MDSYYSEIMQILNSVDYLLNPIKNVDDFIFLLNDINICENSGKVEKKFDQKIDPKSTLHRRVLSRNLDLTLSQSTINL